MENRWLFFNDLKDININKANDESAGSVDDVVLDLQTGGVVFYTLKRGGFLGAGGEKVALPPDVLQFGDREASLMAGEESLAQAPGTSTDWPQHFDVNFVEEVYRHYGYKPTSDR